ncbi:MAG: NADH-quinone oxidoreductase subunit NuoF [Gaiellaceae bacterium]
MAEIAPLSLVLAGTAAGDLRALEEYRRAGGYLSLEKARELAPEAIVDEIKASGIRGRGGAGFPMGQKASFIPSPEKAGGPVYLVVNADESEPGAFKDREIILRVPHRLIEGIQIAAFSIGAETAFVYLRGEYLSEYEVFSAALAEAEAADLVSVPIVVHRGAGAYICGEETALLESLEGKRGQPRSKPPFPAIVGLYASPTLINNVETIATVPKIIEIGGGAYARIGVENSTGTRLFSLSGNVVCGGNYELPHGTTFRELIYGCGGGIPERRKLKAIIPGGSSTPILTPNQLDTPMDFESLQKAGSFLGSASVIAIDERACMVQLALRVTQFYMNESCGKCTPCREGTRWIELLLRKLEDGRADRAELDLLLDVCDRVLGKCLCPLGDSDAMIVASYVEHFRAEFEAHVEQGGCPFGGSSSLEGVRSPVDELYRGRGGQEAVL